MPKLLENPRSKNKKIAKNGFKNIFFENRLPLLIRSHNRALNGIFRFDPPDPLWGVGGVKKYQKWHFWRVWLHFGGFCEFTEQNKYAYRNQHQKIFKNPDFQPGSKNFAEIVTQCYIRGGQYELWIWMYKLKLRKISIQTTFIIGTLHNFAI